MNQILNSKQSYQGRSHRWPIEESIMDGRFMIQKLCASEMNLKGIINDDNVRREIHRGKKIK